MRLETKVVRMQNGQQQTITLAPGSMIVAAIPLPLEDMAFGLVVVNADPSPALKPRMIMRDLEICYNGNDTPSPTTHNYINSLAMHNGDDQTGITIVHVFDLKEQLCRDKE